MIEHESKFTGRGYKKDESIYFEIQLEKPRGQEVSGIMCTVDNFWMKYDCKTNEFEITSITYYDVTMKQKQ